MYAHGIAQVDLNALGIHLLWMGPHSWVYSPFGWFIQRRKYREKWERICDRVDDFARIRSEREIRLRFGILSLRDGIWPTSIFSIAGIKGPSEIQQCDVFTLELDEPQKNVEVFIQARKSFAFALREGKVIAVSGDPVYAQATYHLSGIAIDTVILYCLYPISIQFCIRVPLSKELEEWSDAEYIVSNLQLPIKELMTNLNSFNDECAVAMSRLLPGEIFNNKEFSNLADILRASVSLASSPPRPIDQVLLIRNDLKSVFEELIALDPVRIPFINPKWRRILGLSWFDNDPSLEIGETYEYRITGFFPEQDLTDKIYGFHTIPSKTLLPSEFFLHDLRLRLPQPSIVELGPHTFNSGLMQISRRGILLEPTDKNYYKFILIRNYSLIIDFPYAITSVILELHEGHDLEYEYDGVSYFAINGPYPVPPGKNPRLDFPFPVEHLRLDGRGFLYAIRIPSLFNGLVPVSVELPPIKLEDAPRPDPPLYVRIENLQKSPPILDSDLPPEKLPPSHALGFEIRWLPSIKDKLTIWPSDESSAPQLEATIYQIEHRQGKDFGEVLSAHWEPILSEENWTLGDRDEIGQETRISHGIDLMTVFPEYKHRSPNAGFMVYWRDVFDFEEGGNPILRPVPMPGTYHQYRVRTIDPIGRPSDTWRETEIIRLEKRIPPPIPVGPDDIKADDIPKLPEPVGVHARVLVRDAPDLTEKDKAILGDDDNVIILKWGWHENQRKQDPFAKEFRVYLAEKPLDYISGELKEVLSQQIVSNGIKRCLYTVRLILSRDVVADAAKGSYLQAGYVFYIQTHGAGKDIQAKIDACITIDGQKYPVPVIGPIVLSLRFTPRMTRPPAWSKRVEVQSITEQTKYESNPIRNALKLNPNHTRDSVWVGVSSADDQDYIPDQCSDVLSSLSNRPGNESGIVPVLCEGRYYGRPTFSIPPTLDPVDVFVTPEPMGRPIYFSIDLKPYLSGCGLSSNDLIRPERASADTVFASYYVTEDNRVMAQVIDKSDSGETDQEIIIANPDDKKKVIDGLNSARTEALEDRFAVFLAGSHPYSDRLFEPAAQDPVPFGPFQETLPPKSGRYVYRVRKSDAAGHLSAGGAVAKVIVRVPSLASGAAPERVQPESSDVPGTLRLRIAPELELTHVLSFSQVVTKGSGPVGEAKLLRVPNRPDLYAKGKGILLQLPEGVLLKPQVKSLCDIDIILDNEGFRRMILKFSDGPGKRVRVWVCTLTRDGIPSLLGGPWSLVMPLKPLPKPKLAVSGILPNLLFTWSWPIGPTYNVALERSSDDTNWERISPIMSETVTTYDYAQASDNWHYRLLVLSYEGRTTHSNVVIP